MTIAHPLGQLPASLPCRPFRFNLYGSEYACFIVPKARPLPILGLRTPNSESAGRRKCNHHPRPPKARGRGHSHLLGRRQHGDYLRPGRRLPGFRCSPLSLRDGNLAQVLAEQDARAMVHPEFEHERWKSVLATACRYSASASVFIRNVFIWS